MKRIDSDASTLAFDTLDAEQEEQYRRGKALNAEYYAFVEATELNPGLMADWAHSRRRELEIDTQKLIADNQSLRDPSSKGLII